MRWLSGPTMPGCRRASLQTRMISGALPIAGSGAVPGSSSGSTGRQAMPTACSSAESRRTKPRWLDLFEQVFLLAIDEGTQLARLAVASRAVSPDRTDAIRKQITAGRRAFQSQMLALGAIPLDATAPPDLIADTFLVHLGLHRDRSTRGLGKRGA